MHGDVDDEPAGPIVEEEADRAIDPGRPRAENVAFVLFGMVLTILVFLRGLGLV